MANQLPVTQRDDMTFRVLRLLAEHPEYSQREMARALGMSLGRINYCLRALIQKGYIKVENFKASSHKLRYLHVLTPGGLAVRAELAAAFLARKLAEYEALEHEIAKLRMEQQQS